MIISDHVLTLNCGPLTANHPRSLDVVCLPDPSGQVGDSVLDDLHSQEDLEDSLPCGVSRPPCLHVHQVTVLDLETSEDRCHPLPALTQLDQEAQRYLGVSRLVLQRLQQLSLVICYLRDRILLSLGGRAEQRQAGLPLNQLLKLGVPNQTPRFTRVTILEK